MKNIVIGVVALLVIVGGVIAVDRMGGDILKRADRPDDVTITALVGGEKIEFLRNEGILKILDQRYGITLDARKAGSIAMVTDKPAGDIDALWPSNEVAAEIYNNRHGKPVADELIFNSPIVMYTWKPIAEALIQQGIVEKQDNVFYVVDTQAMIQLVLAKKDWKEIGVKALWGKVAVQSTNPAKSNSGNMFSGLIANMLSGGRVAGLQDVATHGPTIQSFFKSLGHMEHSSGDIFRKYLDTGIGAKPIIVGYENQLVEFFIANERYRDLIRKEVITLYPQPTIWASHPVIALNTKGKRLIEALSDEEIQEIAWREHGFRSGLKDRLTDTSAVEIEGLPKTITSVMPMPGAEAMEKIIKLIDPDA
ncbi:hypothetical protein [Aestuariispira insulae]|uniref:Extracellular solute-binding protein n=1 Tax=Aestuariispira insulae TaxID=1461337 RepID=A0A3D9H8I6_9PROT|nr:hypothetical protein [Aestuariispira insulae]RED45810.1 hypothetical protein DFP90_11157 [Aestuariispira insulae]